MADARNTYILREEELGTVRIADDLIPLIAAYAATEVDGVASLGGNITTETVRKVSGRSLAQGVKNEVKDGEVRFDLALNVDYDRNIMDITREVQERVKSSVENMTGMKVEEIKIRVAAVDLQNRE